MYNKFFSGFFVLLGVLIASISLFVTSYEAKAAWQVSGIFVGAFGILWLAVSLFSSMDEANKQIKRFKELVKLQHNLGIAIRYKENIEKEYKDILTKEFPAWEENLVSKFSFANEKEKGALLAICPELKTGFAYEKYAEILKSSIQSVSEYEKSINSQISEIAASDENPWLWFHRPIPANIQELVSKF